MSPKKNIVKKQQPQEPSNERRKLTWFNLVLAIFICMPLGYYYMRHVEQLFENDKHFSHLSTLERELSFRTESGLYYYYFKLLVSRQKNVRTQDGQITYKYDYNRKDLLSNIYEKIVNDNRTEHPTTINTLQRFNLYPEVLVSLFYRLFYQLDLLEQKCWTVNRGGDMPPVQSCVGYQEPIYFYSKAVFIIHGFSFVFLFLLCWLLNDYSIEAGLLGCLTYIYNHGEATRVMWTPALRESFAYPFHVLQLVLVTRELRTGRSSYFLLVFTTLFYLLTWQFAQFSLGTQAAALYFTYILGYTTREKLVKLLFVHSLSLALCFIFMFANRMLLASFFSSILCSIWILISLEYLIRDVMKLRVSRGVLWLVVQVILFFVLIISVKKYLLPLVCFIDDDDTHIWDILKSKLSVFTNNEFYTFDTRLYTCAKEFDFLEFETLVKLTKTVLLPLVVLNVFYVGLKLCLSRNSDDDAAPVVYNILQLAAFTLMAGLIMRLKLFWTPHLCICATLLLNEKYSVLNIFYKTQYKLIMKYSIVGILVAMMSVEGVSNLRRQYEIMGEYNDFAMEGLINWVNLNTKEYNSFAGSMPTMANLKLSTNRAIINHPHYENNDLRTRTRLLYSNLYGYYDVKLLYDLLKTRYKVDYLVLESYYCLSHPPDKPECAMSTIAHINDKKDVMRAAKRVCEELLNESAKKYFKKVFQTQHISVYKVLS